MNDQNNNSGNNSTTNQNAYKNQKQIQENIGNFKRNNLSGGMSNNTDIVKNVGGFNATDHPILGFNNRNTNENEEQNNGEENNGEENQNIQNQTSENRVNSPLNLIQDNVKSGVNDVVKNKLFIKLLPIIGVVLGILLFVLLVAAAFQMINVYMGDIDGDRISNIIIGEGFRSTSQIVNDNIENAKREATNRGIDDYDIGILYATVNTGVIVDLNIYDSDYNEVREATYDNDPDNYELNKEEAWSFYQVRKEMLGTIYTPGTMAYNLMGQGINVVCSESKPKFKESPVPALAEYIVNGIFTGSGFVLGSTSFEFPVTTDRTRFTTNHNALSEIIDLVKTIIAFDGENLSFNSYKAAQLKQEMNDNFISAIIDDVGNFFEKYNNIDCEGKYKKAEFIMQNDYNQYFGYISNVFVPTIYNFSANNYTEEEQQKIIEDTISDIVNARNDYYYDKGEINYLTYRHELNGRYISAVSHNVNGMVYMGDVPVSEEGSVALTWKQGGGSKWSSYLLGNTSDTNMGRIGCLVTSIAKLIKVSGTQINADYFDPGVLAATIKDNSGFSAGGGLNSYYKWQNLAPNFNFVTQNSGIYISATSSNISSQVAGYIGDKVGNGYYYIIHIKYLGKDGTTHNHYISVVGSSNGEYVLSDPATSADTYSIENLSSHYRNARIVNVIVFKASDV